MNKRIIITGANGFIGRALVSHFVASGFDVYGWDLNNSINMSCNVVKIDMCSYNDVLDLLKKEKPDMIIHCAGSADVNKSVLNPNSDFLGNLLPTHNLLFASKEVCPSSRIVFLSSAAVYGNPKRYPINEENELNPISPYALHKMLCEEMALFLDDQYKMNIKIVRIFSAYGPGLRKQLFWDMYQKYLTKGKIELFGNGEESRDFIYIDDIVSALSLVARTTSPKSIFNLGSGKETTILTCAKVFCQCFGISQESFSFNGKERSGNPLKWVSDISSLRSIGFTPRTDFHLGIQSYCDWLKGL